MVGRVVIRTSLCRSWFGGALSAALASGLSGCATEAVGHAPHIEMHFANDAAAVFAPTCAPDARAIVYDALTMLHSFEYPEASKLFGKAAQTDPGCAMAHWGLAMSLWQPLWAPPSPAQLAEGSRILSITDGLSMTPKEAAYVNALKGFFSNADTTAQRARAIAFRDQMLSITTVYTDDAEAALFYALALLATADPHDKTYAQQFKAAAYLNWVGTSHPRHPAVLHYTIHAYDYPGLAHLALPAALIYADVAPNSAHAQHMPSHIFTRLGMWDLSLSSNHDSTLSAAEYTKSAHLPGHYDEGLHSIDYLMYAMLQTARDSEAEVLLTELRTIEKASLDNFKVAFTYASSPARFALERREWKEASELVLLPTDFPWKEFPWAQSIHHFARGIGAARSGNIEGADAELKMLKDLQARLDASTLPYWRQQVQVHIHALESWILFGQGDLETALRAAALAADLEDAVDKHPVTPGEVLPARELYADMLLEGNRFNDAIVQYEKVLTQSPNRLNALVGAARAAEGAGEKVLASEWLALVRTQTKSGDRKARDL